MTALAVVLALAATLAWLTAAIQLGTIVGRAIRRRDMQVPTNRGW